MNQWFDQPTTVFESVILISLQVWFNLNWLI